MGTITFFYTLPGNCRSPVSPEDSARFSFLSSWARGSLWWVPGPSPSRWAASPREWCTPRPSALETPLPRGTTRRKTTFECPRHVFPPFLQWTKNSWFIDQLTAAGVHDGKLPVIQPVLKWNKINMDAISFLHILFSIRCYTCPTLCLRLFRWWDNWWGCNDIILRDNWRIET